MEDWNMETLRADHTQTAISITKNKYRIWLCGNHCLIGTINNVRHRRTQVVGYRI
jgi:hypothetical protein